MSDYEMRVDGERVAAADGWRLELVDRDRGHRSAASTAR